MTRILFVICLALFSCQAQKTETEAKDTLPGNGSSVSANPTDTISITQGEQLSDADYGIFHITLVTVENKDSIYGKLYANEGKLELYKDTDKTSLIQTLPLSEDVDFNEIYLNEKSPYQISTVDFNFDGFKDIVILSNSGAHSWWYDIFIFDPKDSQFKKNQMLSELETPSADPVKKEINNYRYGGFENYSQSTYKWIDGTLTLVYELQQDHSGDEGNGEFIHTISTLTSGKMEVASKVKITYNEQTKKEIHCLLEGSWEEFDKVVEALVADSKDQVIKETGCN